MPSQASSSAIQATPRRLALRGALVLLHSAAIKDEILQALDQANDVCIDVSEVDEFDVSFLQILIAAHKTAKLEKKRLTVAETGSQTLAVQIARCGLPASVLPDFRDVLPHEQTGDL